MANTIWYHSFPIIKLLKWGQRVGEQKTTGCPKKWEMSDKLIFLKYVGVQIICSVCYSSTRYSEKVLLNLKQWVQLLIW